MAVALNYVHKIDTFSKYVIKCLQSKIGCKDTFNCVVLVYVGLFEEMLCCYKPIDYSDCRRVNKA